MTRTRFFNNLFPIMRLRLKKRRLQAAQSRNCSSGGGDSEVAIEEKKASSSSKKKLQRTRQGMTSSTKLQSRQLHRESHCFGNIGNRQHCSWNESLNPLITPQHHPLVIIPAFPYQRKVRRGLSVKKKCLEHWSSKADAPAIVLFPKNTHQYCES